MKEFTTLLEAEEEIDKANGDYQEALKKLFVKEITLDECLEYQKLVFEACNNKSYFLQKKVKF
jgi:hypothetical protein